MRALDAAQIDGDFWLQRGIDRLAEIMAQQHIFGRNGGVGFQLEQPMAVGALRRQQRLRRRIDMPVEVESRSFRHVSSLDLHFAARNHFGGAIAGAYRAFDGGGQAGIGPIAGQHEIAPCGLGAGTL